MLRNIARTSRWLAQRQINIFVPVVLRQHSSVLSLKLFNISASNLSKFSTSDEAKTAEHIDQAVYEEICNETLESLCDYFEEIVDNAPNLKGADVTYSDGVLTVSLASYGTYVINRQTPNKQIWLSSPVSGPKRYDLMLKNSGYWLYKHENKTLHQLLQTEISKLVDFEIDFTKCAHSLV